MKAKFPSITNEKSKSGYLKKVPEFVILASDFMLSLLVKSEMWFCDATFSISPKGYYQLLVLLVHVPEYNKNIPCAYIVMSGKFQSLYEMAFFNLKMLLKQYDSKYQRPKKIICDFELALRNSLTVVFDGVEVDGCYFHFCKALWLKSAKLGLKKKPILNDTKILISLLKCLIHIKNRDDKKRMWADICFVFGGTQFTNLLKYFQTYWLERYTIDPENNEALRFRTNNICESQNAKLARYIGVHKPQFGLLLDKLLDIELENRQEHLDKVNNGGKSQISEIDKEQYLPFTELYRLLELKKNEIFHYNLRSQDMKANFSKEILKVIDSCYNRIFNNEDIEDLNINEEEGIFITL